MFNFTKTQKLTIQTDYGEIKDVFTKIGKVADKICGNDNKKWEEIGEDLDRITSEATIDFRTKDKESIHKKNGNLEKEIKNLLAKGDYEIVRLDPKNKMEAKD